MSIISSIYAEYAEDVRIKWAKALRTVLESKKSDKEKLEEVNIITKKIEDFYFSE